MFSMMLLNPSSTISGHIQLLFLVLAVLVVLDQTSPDVFIKKCNYGTGRCRKSCRDNEKRKDNCGKYYVCCLKKANWELSHFAKETKPSAKPS